MPSLADSPHDAVVAALLGIERSCLEVDAAIVERRFADAIASFATQSALTSELAALFEAAPETSPQSDPKVALRIKGILNYRDDQLRRLRAYNDEVTSRLESIGRVNALSRSIGKRTKSGRFFDGQY